MEEQFDDILTTKAYSAQEIFSETELMDGLGQTVTYGSLGEGQDFGLGDEHQKTIAYQPEVATVKRTESHNIGIGDVVELNSINYEVLELLSAEGETAEAIIYKVKDSQEQVFVLKLYYEFNDEHLEPNSDTLQRIREIGGNDILFLYDFGTGPNKYLKKFCFEVTAFAAGSDLLKVKDLKQKFTPQFIEELVIRSIHSGLCTLHHEKIYHCDLKPQNVFFLDEEQTKIVIGDYGSAKSFEKTSEKELSYTTITRGTEFYLAPEQAFGIVSEKNDYYSLGMIVLHLLYPNQVNRQNLRRIFERRTKGLPIIDFNDEFERLNKLIQGLTLQDYNNRWGVAEVEAWLEGKEVSVNYGSQPEVSHLEIGELIIRTGKDLAAYIESDSRFFNELIEDLEGYRMLMAWVKNMQGEQSMKQFDAMISHYKKYFGIDYVKDALLFYFDPAHKVSIGLETFDINHENDIEKLCADFFKAMDTLWKLTDFETLRLYFFRFEYAMRRLRVKSDREVHHFIDKTFVAITQIIDTAYNPDFSEFKADSYIRLRNKDLPQIFHYFNKDRVFKDLRGNEYPTLFEVCELLKANPPIDADDYLQHEKAACLKSKPKSEFIEFIEFCDGLGEMFFRKDVDFELLVNQISNCSEEQYSVTFLREVLGYYRNEDFSIQRELILRLINPELPVNIMGTLVFLYQHGSFKNKIDDFFTALDNTKINASFQIAKTAFFAFEICLLQLSRNNSLVGNTLVEPVLEKINKVLHTSLPDVSKLQANFYRQIDERSLLDILYQFLPTRVFCTHTGDFLNNIEDLGLYYLQYPDQFQNKQSLIEREAFLHKSGNRGLVSMEYEEFIMKVFQARTTFDVKINQILFDENAVNEVSFYYDYENSLDEYLETKGIDANFTHSNQVVNSVVVPKKIYSTDEEIFDAFSNAIRKKHTFGKLTQSTHDAYETLMVEINKADFKNSFFLIPRYLVYLMPAFGMIYLSLSYMLDDSLFKQISYFLSPTLNFISVRLAISDYGNLLFVSYFLNIMVGFFLLFPLLSLRRQKKRFEQFNQNHSRLVSRLTLLMLFAPFLFLALFGFIEVFMEGISFNIGAIGLEINAISFSILLYIVFMFYQTLKVISAFFKVSKKIRVWPMTIAVVLYFALGYFALINHNFNIF